MSTQRIFAQANVTDSTALGISDKALATIDDKYKKLTTSIDKQTLKLVHSMQRAEAKLQKKMQGVDSIKAKELFAGTPEKYQHLQSQLQNPVSKASNQLKEYSSGIDSVSTSLQYLLSNKLSLSKSKLDALQSLNSQVQELQGRLQQANDVQAFIKEREQFLKDQLIQYGLEKRLLGINKQVYYYQQQLRQFKELINNPDKLAETILVKVHELPAFQSFWQRNSMLAQLFPMPQNYGTPAALTGLQTRDQVAGIISQRLPGAINADGSGSNYLQQQLQSAQTQMSTLKDKINKLGGSSDMTMPDFKPNSQKTKSFLERLEYGFDIQNSQSTNFLPTISDIALSVGYKLSDKAVLGFGTSYKLGLGRGLNHIAFTSQGVSMRSYMDIKAKGSFWITGGYEYNYMQQFSKLRDLRMNVDVWQKSALIGITKKYNIGKKKQGNIQLLYDLLYKQETPRGTALKFRVGYSL